MTLILKLDLDMVKMYHCTKNEVSISGRSKVIAQTDIQPDRQAHTRTQTVQKHYLPTYAGSNKQHNLILWYKLLLHQQKKVI